MPSTWAGAPTTAAPISMHGQRPSRFIPTPLGGSSAGGGSARGCPRVGTIMAMIALGRPAPSTHRWRLARLWRNEPRDARRRGRRVPRRLPAGSRRGAVAGGVDAWSTPPLPSAGTGGRRYRHSGFSVVLRRCYRLGAAPRVAKTTRPGHPRPPLRCTLRFPPVACNGLGGGGRR